jgi:hypothetical protein
VAQTSIEIHSGDHWPARRSDFLLLALEKREPDQTDDYRLEMGQVSASPKAITST